MRSDDRYARVGAVVTIEWQTANQIGAAINEVPLDVAYQLRRMVAEGKVERREKLNASNRKHITYRLVR